MIISMEKSTSKRGGTREGAGAPRKAEPTKPHTVMISDRQKEILKIAGGNSYLRKHLDDLAILLNK
jgi:hypothetical protein